jgi:hypothetical protein
MPAMTASSTHVSPIFRALERMLLRRRFAALELPLRLELLALAALLAVFTAWLTRAPLDGLARTHGAGFATLTLAVLLAACVLAGGSFAGARHLARLRRGPGGPEWLALPLDPAALTAHLAWGSRLWGWVFAIPAVGLLAASAGLVPLPVVVASAVAFVLLLDRVARVSCSIALRIAESELRADRGDFDAAAGPARHAIERLLARATRTERTVTRSAPRPWRPGAWAALVRKDLLLVRRAPVARGPALTTLALVLASALAWLLPGDPARARVLAVALAVLAGAALADGLLALAACDPFALLRGLPLPARTVWGARMSLAGGVVLALVTLHSAAAAATRAGSPGTALTVTAFAPLALGLLGANYSVTLFARPGFARRMLAFSLLLALIASLMIPLMGWFVLAGAILHSALRLGRWSRLETIEC